MQESKVCTKCNQIKPLVDFYNTKKTKSGKESFCIACRKKASQIYYENNKELVNRRTVEWQKNNYEKKKKINRDWRRKNPEARKRWVALNRDKTREYSREFSSKNPELAAKNNALRRAKTEGSKRYLITKKEIKKLYGQPCFYCGKESKHLDHVIPLSRGGTHSIGNLVPACQFCNLSKHNKFITEWKKGESC